MVDVVMVILIFFMLGTSFAISEGFLPTQLPSQVGPGGAARVSIIPAIQIALTADGTAVRIQVMNQTIANGSFSALETLLRERAAAGADANSRIVIQAEPSVRYADVVSAMDACVRAGFPKIQFSVSSGQPMSAAHENP